MKKMISENNVMLLTDSYKVSHYLQYPPKSEFVFSYLESRGGAFKNSVFFGLQYYLKKYFAGPVVTREKIDEAEALYLEHFGKPLFNKAGWEYILEKHGGYLPVIIRAVPEGTIMPIRNVLMTVENTDPNCYWLTNFIETVLVEVWYPITIATNSHECRKILSGYLEITGDPTLIDFKLHDFGFRGVSSIETAMIGGASHLVNFLGTDTVAGIVMANNYYDAGVCGYSIPASEHSTITSWGKENEDKAMENMLDVYPDGLVACVSDSFDIYDACSRIWGHKLKEKILHRDGTLVVRPDSGNPPEVVVEVLDILWLRFGGTVNSKGYRVLDPHIRVIQGDGIDLAMLRTILQAMLQAGYSADNLAFGSGGGLLQKFNRDTMQFAFKCCSITIDGQEHDVFKSPITSSAKVSKKGRLKLIKEDGEFKTVNTSEPGEDLLVTVFENGLLHVDYKFADVRALAKA